jgi:hypothetical protein
MGEMKKWVPIGFKGWPQMQWVTLRTKGWGRPNLVHNIKKKNIEG